MIFDTFVFAGEKDLLLERINQLTSHVDFFIICESYMTFSGEPRQVDINFQEQLKNKLGGKIRWQTLPALYGKDAWEREAFQRRSISENLKDIRRGDTIMLSDVDEIPSEEYLKYLLSLDCEDIVIAKMKLFRYCSHFESSEHWHGTVAIKYCDSLPDFQSLRMRSVKFWLEDVSNIFENGGSHFTTFLTARQFKKKLSSFSHSELNVFPINNLFFLFLLIKLGITIDGKEILHLNKQTKNSINSGVCSSNHRFDKLRIKIATLIQPSVKKLFLKKVRFLSTPK